MDIRLIKGDLLKESHNSKAHCVSEDLAMSAGIAAQFKAKYNQIQKLKNQNKKVGEIAFIEYEPKKYIFNLITKNKFYDKPTKNNMKRCLNELAKICKNLNVKYLDMPKIGCGLDKMKWENVQNYIIEAFKDMEISIVIYELV